ncbi:putative leucine-rich repeat-containing protein DDB_G0290503 isoform X2 [Onthophagus taurus]|uniref:putative leucine-rich repeat-containing protein DDB_G0290503 isoform X2 n=1 Tax=Onthophagus taurus TaxID=166361 RepID=UPI0039BE7362
MSDLSFSDFFAKSKEAGDVKAQDHVINQIFFSCAGENDSLVNTDKLISFITPFLHDNAAATQLRNVIDPNNLNEEIDFDQFYLLMETWISTMSVGEDFHRSDFHGVDYGDLDCKDKGKSNKDLNKTNLEEQIQELEYQKKKMAEEMEQVKLELANSLEINENLQDRLDKSLKKIKEEQKLVEKLQESLKNKDEDHDVETERIKKLYDGLQKKVISLEIKIAGYNDDLIELQNENEKLEEKNQRLLKEKDAIVDELFTLQKEINEWKEDFASQQELYATLHEEKKNLEDTVEEYLCEIEKLRFEKTTLESLLNKSTFSSSFTQSRSFNKSNNKSDTNRSMDDLSKESDSGDELPIKLHYMAAMTNTNESLQEEISKATSEGCSFVSDNSTEKSYETEEKSHSIQSEINLKTIISELNNNVSDLKTRLSLSEEKEAMLLERNRELEANLEEKRRNLKEIMGKVKEYHKLETKCKELTAKINDMEHENGLKHIKIVDLTLELDHLKKNKKMNSSSRGIKIESQQKEDELNRVIEEVKREKDEIESEKRRLEDVLRSLEEERVTLKIEIQTHLTEIMRLEENGRDLKHELTLLRYERDNLEMKTSAMQVKLESIENENEELRKDNERLLSAKSSNSTLEKEQRDLNELTFKLKLEKLQTEKEVINENWRKEREQLMRKLGQKVRDLESCEAQLDQYEQDKCELEDEIDGLKEELGKVKEDVIEKDKLINEMKEEIDLLRGNVKEFEGELKRKESKLFSVSNELVLLKESKENINQELFLYKNLCDDHKKKIERMEVLIGELEGQVEEKKVVLNEQGLKLTQLQREIDEKLGELKEITEKFDGLKQQKEDEFKSRINYLENDVEKKKNIIKTFIKENKNLKTLLKNPEEIFERIRSLSEENEELKKLNKNFPIDDKSKMIDEINKSFSEAMQKVYFTEKIMHETEEDLTLYCKREIEKYKKENEALKKSHQNEISNLLKEIETTKSELELVMGEKSFSLPNLKESKKSCFDSRSESKLKRLNHDKLTFKNDKLEKKILDLQDELNAEKESKRLKQIELKEILSQNRINLENVTLNTINSFLIPSNLLKKNDAILTKIHLSEMLENEVLKVKAQIEMTSGVLDYLCLKKSGEKEIRDESCQTEVVEMNLAQNKSGFVLNPATFVPKCYDPVESLQFACSGDAGRSRDLGVMFTRSQENEDYYGLQNDSREETVFATLNEELLQNFGLINYNLTSFQEIPDSELEETFKKISSAYTADQQSISTRLQKQTEKTANKKRKYLEEISICKKILQDEFLNSNGLENVTARLDSTGKSCEDLTASAELLGSLKKEKEMMGCLGVMIVYLERSRIVLKNVENQLRSIESLWIKDEKRQFQAVSFKPLNLEPINKCLSLERSGVNETHISPRPISKMIKTVTYSFITWMIFMGISCLMVVFLFEDDYNYLSWGFNTFEHPWMPFVRKQYLRGPPPT